MATLHSDLVKALEDIRAERAFDVEKWIDQKTDLFNDYMRKCGLKACVVSVSGGVDSACSLALMKAAASKPNSPIERVLGIAQPIHSTSSIWRRALEVGEALGVEMVTVDQTEIEDQLSALVHKAVGIEGEMFSRGQLRSYMRTPVGYYVAQLISQSGKPCVVIGTGNYDEDGYLCYFCKAGDGVVDVQLIADIHKSEVFRVSERLGVPESILRAPPSADLWEGQTDEDELGFGYDFIELLTEIMKMPEDKQAAVKAKFSEEARAQYDSLAELAAATHRRNAHKLNFPVNLDVL